MGFTGLARWINAPPTGLDLISENITKNQQGRRIAKWSLTIRSYRSTLGQIPGFNIPSERTMSTLTMQDNVFVLVEDPLAPTAAEVVEMNPNNPNPHFPGPSHYRTCFLTLSPPNALEPLLQQLKARWSAVRQSSSSNLGATAPGTHANTIVSSPQLSIEGHVFAIGTDWRVRVGNVTLAGGAVKGMILEAEYLPLPTLHSPIADGTSELLSNMLTSILPNIRDAKTMAITITEDQWREFLWDREEEEYRRLERGPTTEESDTATLRLTTLDGSTVADGATILSETREDPGIGGDGMDVDNQTNVNGDKPTDGNKDKEMEKKEHGREQEEEDIYVHDDGVPEPQRGDWSGIERDRRSAFLIMGALKSEGIL